GVRLSTAKLETLVRDAERAFSAARMREASEPLCRDVLAAGSVFFANLPRPREQETGRRALPHELREGALQHDMLRLDAALEALEGHAKLSAHASEAIAQIARRCRRARDDMAVIFDAKQRHVTWVEARGLRASIGA